MTDGDNVLGAPPVPGRMRPFREDPLVDAWLSSLRPGEQSRCWGALDDALMIAGKTPASLTEADQDHIEAGSPAPGGARVFRSRMQAVRSFLRHRSLRQAEIVGRLRRRPMRTDPLIEDWITTLAPGSRQPSRRGLSYALWVTGKPPGDLAQTDIDAIRLNPTGLSPDTVRQYVSATKSFLRHAGAVPRPSLQSPSPPDDVLATVWRSHITAAARDVEVFRTAGVTVTVPRTARVMPQGTPRTPLTPIQGQDLGRILELTGKVATGLDPSDIDTIAANPWGLPDAVITRYQVAIRSFLAVRGQMARAAPAVTVWDARTIEFRDANQWVEVWLLRHPMTERKRIRKIIRAFLLHVDKDPEAIAPGDADAYAAILATGSYAYFSVAQASIRAFTSFMAQRTTTPPVAIEPAPQEIQQ